MTKLLLLFLISCASVQVPKTEIPAKVIDIIVEDRAKADLITVTMYSGFTEKEIIKAKKYIPKMNEVVASKCFEEFMVNRKMIKTNGLTNLEVVNKIVSSNAKIELIMYTNPFYKRWSTVAGYTEPGANWIKLNRKYHSGASLCSEGSNLSHELIHKFGFGHSYKATTARPYSVPYSANAAFKYCCK